MLEFRRILLHQSDEIKKYLDGLNDSSIIFFIEQLKKTKGKIVFIGVGKSGLVGRKISATFASLNIPSFFIHPSEAFHGDLGMLSVNDSVIFLSNSGESAEVIQLLPYIRLKVSKSFSITKNPKSTIALGVDYHLTVGVEREGCPLNLAPMSSTTLLMAVGDAIAGELTVKKNISERDFASNHPGGEIGRKLYLSVNSILRSWIIEKSKLSFIDLISYMIEHKASAVIMKSNNNFRLITDGDIRRSISKGINQNIDNLGSIDPHSIQINSSLMGLKQRMSDESISHMVVLDGRTPVGIINKSDLL